jgi:thymidylate kinase
VIIVLNGPLGIGKSTLGEALAESIDQCVFLNGDSLITTNPPPPDETAYLHATIVLLVAHHRRHGYRHFVVDHFWKDAAELDDLRSRMLEIDPEADVRCFLLTLPLDENQRRIERRQAARALDERDFEQRTVVEERDALARHSQGLGEPFDVSMPPNELVAALRDRLGIP